MRTKKATPRNERGRLDQIARNSLYDRGISALTVQYATRIFARHWRKPNCLELGPAEGHMTAVLAKEFPTLTVVEGAKKFCTSLKKRYPDITVVHSLFEDFDPSQRFDTIILGHVLEHLNAPAEFLRRARAWLKPNGVICAAVPNARSLHRQLGVLASMLKAEDALNQLDHHHGHRRVYNPETFRNEFLAAGLKIQVFGGFYLKCFSNPQIEALCNAEVREALMQLGERYPDICGDLYLIASR